MAAKGEIDTDAPFQSVKDAVTLFGTGTFSRGKHTVERPEPRLEERVLTKQTKLHLPRKELNLLKEKIKNAETTKAEALLELEKAKIVVLDLSDKLSAADGSTESAIRATEVARDQGKQNKQADSALGQDLASAMENMRNKESHDLDSVRAVTSELDVAKESLQRVAEEENGLCRMLESLKLELEDVLKEHAELKEKELETEAIARDLQAQLQETKTDLETCEALGETISTLETKAEAEELKKEAKDVKIELQVLEEELKSTLLEAEEAKSAAENAHQRGNRLALSESKTRITISREKFETLHKKAEKLDELAEIEVAAALAEVDATRACTDEALKRLEMNQRDIKDLKAARIKALKKAETAEGAKRAAEAELKRWLQREQKKAAEVATRILAETKISVKSSSHHSNVLKRNPAEKPQKSKTNVSKNVLWPSLGGIFHLRKNQNEARSTSCLPS